MWNRMLYLFQLLFQAILIVDYFMFCMEEFSPNPNGRNYFFQLPYFFHLTLVASIISLFNNLIYLICTKKSKHQKSMSFAEEYGQFMKYYQETLK